MEGLSLGPLFLRWNGLLIMLGFALGGILATRESKRRGLDPEIVLDLVLPFLIWGTIGARLWHILTPPLSSVQLGLTTGHYLTHPLDLFNLIFLIWLSHRFENRLKAGYLFMIYLINYGIIRILLEFLRLDVSLVHGVNVNQAFMLITVLVSGAVLYMHNRPAREL